MPPDDSQPEVTIPSFFSQLFTVIGSLIAISAIAGILTLFLIAFTGWSQFLYSIYGLSWGATAHWLRYSARQGIKRTLDTDTLTPDRRRALGEQLVMLEITRWFVRCELVASAILLVV